MRINKLYKLAKTLIQKKSSNPVAGHLMGEGFEEAETNDELMDQLDTAVIEGDVEKVDILCQALGFSPERTEHYKMRAGSKKVASKRVNNLYKLARVLVNKKASPYDIELQDDESDIELAGSPDVHSGTMAPEEKFSAKAVVNGTTVAVYWDTGYEEYVLRIPGLQMNHEAGIWDDLIRLNTDVELAKRVFEIAKHQARSKTPEELYKLMNQMINRFLGY